MSEHKWKWALGFDKKNDRCVAACGESLVAYRNMIISYRGRLWHAHCLLDYLVEKDPPEAPVGIPNIWGGWGAGGGVTP